MLDELNHHRLALLQLKLLHELLLLVDQTPSTLFTLLASSLSKGLLCALLKTSRFESERASLSS